MGQRSDFTQRRKAPKGRKKMKQRLLCGALRLGDFA
jgi:hypothetical protein